MNEKPGPGSSVHPEKEELMKRLSVVLVIMGLAVGALPAVADVPSFVTYSGRLTDGTGWGQSDVVDLTFRIYGCGCIPDGQCEVPCVEWPGTPLKEQGFPGAAIEDGYFSVILSEVANVFAAHAQTWITVCVGVDCQPEGDLLPRQAVGSVPYAVRAENAAGLGWDEVGSDSVVKVVDGKVGIGIQPTQMLDIDGPGFRTYIRMEKHASYGAAYFGKYGSDMAMWGVNHCHDNIQGAKRDVTTQPSAFVSLETVISHPWLFKIRYAHQDDWPTFTTLFTINKNGNVGIGKEPTVKLDVNGAIYATSCPACSSDARIKRNVRPVRDALDKVLALTGVSFEFDGSDYPELDLPEGSQIGLIAQEVEEVLPEVVLSPPDGGLKSVKYANLVAVLIEAVKEQQGQIDVLREENEDLHTRLDRLEAIVVASAKSSGRPGDGRGGAR